MTPSECTLTRAFHRCHGTMAAAEKRENNMQTTWESDGRRAEPGRSAPSDSVGKHTTGWWCKNHLEKYEFVNGKDDIPYMKWTIISCLKPPTRYTYSNHCWLYCRYISIFGLCRQSILLTKQHTWGALPCTKGFTSHLVLDLGYAPCRYVQTILESHLDMSYIMLTNYFWNRK